LTLKAPLEFAGYSLFERRDSGIPADGITHRYSAPDGETWTTYFYRPGPDDFSGSPEQSLDAEISAFKQVLAFQRSQGLYDEYEIVAEAPDPLLVDGVTLPGRKLGFVFRRIDTAYVSVFLVYAIRDGFVKIRGSVVSDVWEREQPVFAEEFLQALLSLNQPL
jgi:hypothetical protein